MFGISPLAYQRYRMTGWSPGEIGAAHGRSPATARGLALPILRTGAARGVAGGHTPPEQARRMLSLQRDHLTAWLDQRVRPRGRPWRVPTPALRSRRELACWLFAGPAGLEQVRTATRSRAAGLVCKLAAPEAKERR